MGKSGAIVRNMQTVEGNIRTNERHIRTDKGNFGANQGVVGTRVGSIRTDWRTVRTERGKIRAEWACFDEVESAIPGGEGICLARPARPERHSGPGFWTGLRRSYFFF